MRHTTLIDNTKLSVWYYAVRWSIQLLQQKIAKTEAEGYLDPSFDIKRLAELEDLEQFLKMSWDEWMESLATSQTAVEESK